VVHLFERDCSIQRRHQKVIEEAPSPAVSPELRARMGEVACRAARAVGYVGAGTCEFLLSQDRSFYFLEMNTRLQVEHPVTEMITGVDLVKLQIRVAEGHPLPMRQEDLVVRGAAVECRVYAEDPVRFLPSPGTITALRVPQGPGVRDDGGVYAGSEISVFYDPMISKLITWGEGRAHALDRMRRALAEYRVAGIKTNLLFHRRMLEHAEFLAGEYDTGFIERNQQVLCAPVELDAAILDDALAAAAIHATTEAPPPGGSSASASTEPSAWRRTRA
jgi:acetyl-CoA carboxylase biotin carboxylase subunit